MPNLSAPDLTAPNAGQHVHMIGACGAGMCSLANVLRGLGWNLSGSDLSLKQPTGWIRAGHQAANVPDGASLVVYSDAVPAKNCELQLARRLGIATFSYAEVLGRLSAGKISLAVAGTHGKSTTTAMAAAILDRAGLDPTVVVGATPIGKPSGGRHGTGRHTLVEACEYRANFLHLRPHMSVVLNIEGDHFDSFPTLEDLHQAFHRFASQTAASGLLIVSADCRDAQRITQETDTPQETFGWTRVADWKPAEVGCISGRYTFRLTRRGQDFGRVTLQVPGRHNVSNALAAAALCHAAGAPADAIVCGLSQFRGLRRRLEHAGELCGIHWIDDYAHHPTEIAASLASVRQQFPRSRIWCVFQPHQVSRTQRLFEPFAGSLCGADHTFVAETFTAREPCDDPEVTSQLLAARCRALGVRVATVHQMAEIGERLAQGIARNELTRGDVIITMGAGDIGKLGYDLFERFREYRAA